MLKRGPKPGPRPGRYKFTDTEKYCASCDKTLPRESFCKNKRLVSGLNHYCKPCVRRHIVFQKYGLTASAHEALLKEQNYKCANRGCNEGVDVGSDIDHDRACCPGDHKTCGNCVRGVLCKNCNKVMGFMNDSVAKLRGAADYLEGVRSKRAGELLSRYELMVENATGVASFYTAAQNIEKNLV